MKFNPARLAIARKRKKLTCKALAEIMGVSPVTITRIENGQNSPDDKTVNLIVEKIGFSYEFFFGGDIDELPKEAASFRSLSSITARERDAALAAGTIAYMLSDWVERKFNLPDADLLDLSNEQDPQVAALSLRIYWGLGHRPINNMIKLLEAKGVRVFSLVEDTKNVDAFSCWRNETPFVFLNTFKSAERSRMDAAHELAHLVLHKHGGPDQKEAEQQANSFASAFLMPDDDVRSNIGRVRSLDEILLFKKRWGVSVSALTYRLHKMGMLTDWQSRNFYIEINQRGYRTKEPDGIPHEESVIWKKVFLDLWSEKIGKNKIANELGIPLQELEYLIFGLYSANNK